jgi:hypothetical protein
MSDSSKGTLAQMLFAGKPALNFAHVVGELDSALARYPATRRALAWDCDDLATFDLDSARIVLAYAEDLPRPDSACLTVSVGIGPEGTAPSSLAVGHEDFCRKIIDRLSDRYEADAILWHKTDAPVTARTIDDLIDSLPDHELTQPEAPGSDVDRLLARMSVELNSRSTPPAMNFARPEPDKDLDPVQPVRSVANDTPDLPRLSDPELARIRAALYADPAGSDDAETGEQSAQMRLAIHAMNATMMVVCLPVGLAAMVSGLRQGENLRFSAQMLALTGLFGAIWQTQGAQLVAMI